MGFFIQDDYIDSMADMTKAEQNVFLGAIFRLYTTGVNEIGDIKSKAVRVAFNACKGRVISARKEADRKAEQRDNAGTNHGTNHGTDAGTDAGNALNREGEGEGDREIEGEKKDDVVVLLGDSPDEIGCDPDGFAHFMAECIRLYNEATGQLYMAPTGAARQGMLDAFKAGRTLDDVNRVMDDVASWPRNMQTLNGVWADGKFEQHVNFVGGGGADVPDWSEFNDLVTRVS